MAITFKILADGQLPIAEAALYTVPASTQSAIKNITLFNTSASDILVTIKIKKSGGTARTHREVTLKGKYTLVIDDLETPGAGGEIRGVAGTAAVIDYTIHGIERT